MDPDFSDQLRAAMKARGYSAPALAREIGASKRTVSRWVNGHKTPSPTHHARLIQVLPELAPRDLASEMADLRRRLEVLERKLGGGGSLPAIQPGAEFA